jgi:AcrR family transcriptional regulator
MTDSEMKERILTHAEEHFLRLGFSKVTMTELAADLGISKKTLYLHFLSKEELLTAMMHRLHDESNAQIQSLVNDQEIDFIEKLRRLLNLSAEFHKRITPTFLADVRRSAPGVCKESDFFWLTKVETVLSSLIREGIEKKVFRNDLNEKFLVMMHIGAVQFCIRSDALAQLPLTIQEVIQTIGKVMFYGILSEEGRAQIRERAAAKAVMPAELQQ